MLLQLLLLEVRNQAAVADSGLLPERGDPTH